MSRGPALALVGLLGACACGLPVDRASRPDAGGMLVVALRGDVESWNPYVVDDATSAYLLDLLYPRLVREIPANGPDAHPFAPWLATAWERSPDRRSWTFHLRDDARWSDGSRVTCTDVAFTFRAQRDEALAWDGSFIKDKIEGVDCPDQETVVFRYTTAYDPFAQVLDANDDAVVPASYGEIPFESWRSTAWHTRAKTCGPFRLTSVVPSQEAVLERDANWWGARDVVTERVILRVYPEASSAVDRLIEGGVDMVPRVPPEKAGVIAASTSSRLEELPSLTFTYIGWNVLDPEAYTESVRSGAADDDGLIARLRTERAHPILADARVRRALAMAIDREDLVRGLWGGHADVGTAPIPPTSWAYDAPASGLPFDRSRARAMLAEAGWRDIDGDGQLDRGGRRFELSVLLNAENKVRRDAFERVAASLSAIGVRLVADPVPRAEFNARAREKRFDAILAGRSAGTRVEPQALLHGREAARRGNNVTSWSTPESDALLDRAAAATDGGVALWRDWLELYRDEQPLTVLYFERTLVGLGGRVRGDLPWSFNPFFGLPGLGTAPG